jgi:hypothetical protein
MTWKHNYIMTLPDERYRAVIQTEKFLKSLCFSSETKRVPLAVRQQARALLRHYPTEYDMSKTAQTSPDIFAERMEDVARMFKYYEQKKAEDDKA